MLVLTAGGNHLHGFEYSVMPDLSHQPFSSACIDQVDVVELIMGNKSNAMAFDYIRIKIILSYILPYITYIFNTVIITGI